MPELPEVETTCRGIAQHIEKQRIEKITIRESRLRWPIPASIKTHLKGQIIHSVSRRAKYLLLKTDVGTLILHLGMSGSLRVIAADTAHQKHDHFDLHLSNGQCLRLRDPRRFGAVLFTKKDPAEHKLLRHLGPEPLSQVFTAEYLYHRSRKRQVSIKSFIMDSKIVVGVGNIYASEALFMAGIHPRKISGKLSQAKLEQLVAAIKTVLQSAIKAGGTTLRDFSKSDGKPGYFKQELQVYGRKGEPCVTCGKLLSHAVIAQRATYYCTQCQR